MALSRAAPRDHIHSRDIRCRGFKRADGLWDIEGTLEDTKTYAFDNRDRGGISAGEPIHRMRIRLTVDDNLTVRAAEAETEAGPFDICGTITPVFAGLVGLQIGPGWRRAVMARMAGAGGCTHLSELLLGPMTTTVMQTVGPARRRRQSPSEGASGADQRPALIDSCHAFKSDGPVVEREWPAFFTGGKDGD